MNQYKCWCYNCLKDINENGWPVTMGRMILCPTCGNKRCPRATDHTNACTNSNEPGQEGSRYSNNFYKTEDTWDIPIGTGYNPDNSFNFDSMKIKQATDYDPIVVTGSDGKQIFKITKDGNIFWNGREIKGDDELVKATTEFMNKMTGYMISPSYNPYNIGRDLYLEGKGISDIFAAVKSDTDIPEAMRGYTDEQTR